MQSSSRSRAVWLLISLAIAAATLIGCAAQEPVPSPEAEPPKQEDSEQQADSVEPLALTLTGPSRCTTTRGQSYGLDEDIYDDEGNYLRTELRFHSHRDVSFFLVSWSVSGGSGPYTLMIDGATEDRTGPFTGASGRGQVFCAETTVATFIDDIGNRGFRADPMIDSGWKTVHAVVTDAAGRIDEASIDVYVILSTGDHEHLLRGGATYEVFDHLITIPAGINMRIGAASSGSDGGGVYTFYIEGTDPLVLIWLEPETFAEIRREVPRDIQGEVGGTSSYSDIELQEFHSALDSFANSVGGSPNSGRSRE